MTAEELLKPEEVAPMLRKSVKAVRLMCQLRQIRHLTEARGAGSPRYLIPESAVAEWKQQHTVDTQRALRRAS